MALATAINRLITERGWEAPAAVGGMMGRWPRIVGDDLVGAAAEARRHRGAAEHRPTPGTRRDAPDSGLIRHRSSTGRTAT